MQSQVYKTEWIRFYTIRKNCPICAHRDGCSISSDGKIIMCARVESDKKCGEAFAGGWLHKLAEPIKYKAPPKQKPVTLNFTVEAQRYVQNLFNYVELAQELGVSEKSLIRLQVGWNGYAFTFPMSDAKGNIIGIRIRGKQGKWSIPGSRNGIFWPAGVHRDETPLVICEGATDCAALLDLGYNVIGRPSCSSGTEYILEFLRGKKRDVIIMADNDSPKTLPDGGTWRPGKEGAFRLAEAIKPLCASLKVIKPPFKKDARAWVNKGATREVIDSIIRNTKNFGNFKKLLLTTANNRR